MERRIRKIRNTRMRKKHLDTLTFYRQHLEFKKPSKVLLDGSIFYYLSVKRKTLRDIRTLIKDSTAIICTTACVVREMEYSLQTYSRSEDPLVKAIDIAKKVEHVGCSHGKEVSAETCIRCVVGLYNSEKFIVATTVNRWWPLLDRNPSIPIITVKDGSLVVKQLSTNRQKKAKGWSSTPAVKMSAIKNEELPTDSNYKRLFGRFGFYGYDGAIALGDGNNQIRAIMKQLGSSVVSHEETRENLVNQMLLHSELYEDKMLLKDLYRASKNGEWGTLLSMQAAADAYGVKIVVLDSSENYAVYDFYPYGVEHPNKVLSFSCFNYGKETHYNSIQKLIDRSIASTCRYNYMGTELEGQEYESGVAEQRNP